MGAVISHPEPYTSRLNGANAPLILRKGVWSRLAFQPQN